MGALGSVKNILLSALLCTSVPLIPATNMAVAFAAPENSAADSDSASEERAGPQRVPVTLDGEVLFRVVGFESYPAPERAKAIRQRLTAIAADRSVAIDSLHVDERGGRTRIVAGDRLVMNVFDVDAARAGVSRQILADQVLPKITAAIAAYRTARSLRALLTNTLYAAVATAILALLLVTFGRTFRRLDALAERRLRHHIERLEAQSHQLIHARQLVSALHGLLKLLGVLGVLAALYVHLHFVLSLYPWTRPLAMRLLETFIDPLAALATGFIDVLPNLVFVAILVLVIRYALKLTRLYFSGIEHGTIVLANFDQEWARPTYKIVRLILVVSGVVIAYPYIPGSSSEAFRGVSILLGVMLSLGSSSVIANLIAGYAMIYRRAFKVGDRIIVNDLTGDVTEIRLMVTHLRTVKNEEIIVPNSEILNTQVVNYSSLAKSRGLILHTTVGIGYGTPWRQVEAMLRQAAERTPGLLKEPPPFILQTALNEFAVTYELNAYCDEPQRMAALYTTMHQNILDVFNEHGVQIMTPAYEGDPEAPKVVPKGQWYLPPAKPVDVAAYEGAGPERSNPPPRPAGAPDGQAGGHFPETKTEKGG